MAVDTFLKICQKCKKKFVIVMANEQLPFVEDMATHVAQDIADLEHLHICTYFEAVGHMIAAAQAGDKARLVDQLMRLFNEKWTNVLRTLNSADPLVFLQDQQVLREISLILRVNERMVSSAGVACHRQLGNIYMDMLKIYKVCSDYISRSTAEQGVQVMGFAHVRLMRNVKRDTLRLVQTFVDAAASEVQANEKKMEELQAADLRGCSGFGGA